MITKLNLDGLVNNGVNSLLGAGSLFTTGKVFYVSSVIGSNGNVGEEPTAPLASIAQAIASVRANKGDKIVVLPNHSEAVTATSINLSVAGVTIINLGNGKADKPTYTFGLATSTITVSAADVTWVGGYGTAGVLDVASAFTVGAGKDFNLIGAEFEDTSSILNFLSIVTTGATDNAADGLTVIDNSWYGLNTTPLAFISVLGDIARLNASNNFVDSASTADVASFITFAAKDSVKTRIENNTLIVTGATGATVGIFLTGSGTAHTGIVSGNKVASLDTTTELIATAGTGLAFFENYYTGTADKSGKLWPVVDAA